MNKVMANKVTKVEIDIDELLARPDVIVYQEDGHFVYVVCEGIDMYYIQGDPPPGTKTQAVNSIYFPDVS